MHRHKYTDIQQELICNVSTTEENICLFDLFVLVDTDFSSLKQKKTNKQKKKQQQQKTF